MTLGAFALFGNSSCYVTFESDNSIIYPENLICESDQLFDEEGFVKFGPPTNANTIIESPIPVSSETTRYSRIVCGWVCAECAEDEESSVRECYSWIENCDTYATEVALYSSYQDMQYGVAMSSSEDGPYEGCGPTAIYNVAEYLDAGQLTAAEIRDQITTYQFSEDSIGTGPNDLLTGLKAVLNEQSEREILVFKHAGADANTIRYYLSRGYPVIALVENGNHYVVVTGFVSQNDTYLYRIIDYYGYDRWVLEDYLSLEVDVNASVFSPLAELVSAGTTGWVSGTIFTFSQAEVWP